MFSNDRQKRRLIYKPGLRQPEEHMLLSYSRIFFIYYYGTIVISKERKDSMFKKAFRRMRRNKLKKKLVKQLWGIYYKPYTWGDCFEILKIYGYTAIVAIVIFGIWYKYDDYKTKKTLEIKEAE